MNDALISIKPQHVEKIFQGLKTAELRTRSVNLQPGTKLWIYSTIPQAKIEGVTRIKAFHSGRPSEIWKDFSDQICISKKDFDSYVKDYKEVHVIILTCPKRLASAPDLNHLRTVVSDFHPPQFFKKLSKGTPLIEYLSSLTTHKDSSIKYCSSC